MRRVKNLAWVLVLLFSACMHKEITPSKLEHTPVVVSDNSLSIAKDLKSAFMLYAQESKDEKTDPTLDMIAANVEQADPKDIAENIEDEEMQKILKELAEQIKREEAEKDNSTDKAPGTNIQISPQVIGGITLLAAGLFVVGGSIYKAFKVNMKFSKEQGDFSGEEFRKIMRNKLEFELIQAKENPHISMDGKRGYLSQAELARLKVVGYGLDLKETKVANSGEIRYYLDESFIEKKEADVVKDVVDPKEVVRLEHASKMTVAAQKEISESLQKSKSEKTRWGWLGFAGFVIAAVGSGVYLAHSEDSENQPNPQFELAAPSAPKKVDKAVQSAAAKKLLNTIDALGAKLAKKSSQLSH